jgi:signal transduction histidine kinase
LDEHLGLIAQEAGRTAQIVENLLRFSRRRGTRRTAVDIHRLLDRCVFLFAYSLRTGGISVKRVYPVPPPNPEVDEFQLQQVIMSLLINAVQALREAGTRHAEIRLCARLSADGHQAVIEVEDNGPGIPAALAERVFEPFFTTKRDEQGTGLGLTVARGIVREHGGDVTLGRIGGPGALFRVCLPISQEHAAGGVPQSADACAGNQDA